MNYSKINKITLLCASLSVLSACGNIAPSTSYDDPSDYSNLRIVSPTGAPALALFTEGNNSKWETTTNPTYAVAAAYEGKYQGSDVDVVIAPVLGAFDKFKEEGSPKLGLARVITGGNFYLVGVNKTADEKPTNSSYIVGFAEQDISGKVLTELYKHHWQLGEINNIHWVNGAANTLEILKAGKHNGNDVDFVLTAEPVFTNAKSQLDEGVTLVETYDIRKEWKDYSGQDALVQAGVFIRKDSLESKKNQYKAFLDQIDGNIDLATNPDTISEVVATLNAYDSNVKNQASRFGYNVNLVNALQSNNKNRFALVKKEVSLDIEAFFTSLGVESYDASYLVSLD